MGMCCEKKTLIGWRNIWNTRWRASDQEVDQRGRRERLCKKIAKHVIRTGRMLWIVEEADKGWMMIRIVVGWVFLLVLAHPGSPGQRAVKWLLLLWSPYGIGQTIIFLPCGYFFLSFFLSSFFLSSPNLSRRRLDVCHTSTHGVALVQI